MLTTTFLNKVASFIDTDTDHATARINGATITVPIRRTIISGATVRKQIYLTDVYPFGTVDLAQLISKDGTVSAQITDMNTHVQGQGLLLEFRFNVKEV